MKASSHLDSRLHRALREMSNPATDGAISDVVATHGKALVTRFYECMMKDREASKYLSVNSVEARLKPGLERWLDSLFCRHSPEEIEAALAMQRHVGDVHARAEIPMHLVARGLRLLKFEIRALLANTDLARDDLFMPIRLLPTPTTYSMLPFSRV